MTIDFAFYFIYKITSTLVKNSESISYTILRFFKKLYQEILKSHERSDLFSISEESK